jgi:DNA-binding MarR family transcriptional regulator
MVPSPAIPLQAHPIIRRRADIIGWPASISDAPVVNHSTSNDITKPCREQGTCGRGWAADRCGAATRGKRPSFCGLGERGHSNRRRSSLVRLARVLAFQSFIGIVRRCYKRRERCREWALNRDRPGTTGSKRQPAQDNSAAGAARKKAKKPLAEILGEQKVAGLRINLQSMALISNIHRASGLIRQHFERTVLEEAGLHWSAFVTLWCLWIYGDLETRRLAAETGVAKSTLSSILNMLEDRKLIRRRANEEERRLVIVNLTAAGAELISALFPKFNSEETRIAARLTTKQMSAATDAIRTILATIAELDDLDEDEA